MALQILVHYQNQPVTYDVTMQDSEVFQLRLNGDSTNSGDGYLPEKLIIRRKGKIWISDLETYQDLVRELTREVSKLTAEYNY